MIVLSQKPLNVSRKVTVAHLENFRTLLNIFRNHRMPKNILRSFTKNCGTCRASHEDENLNKLTPLWYQNVKVKHSVFALRMMSDELSSWKVALYARCQIPTSTECFAEIARWESSAAEVLDWYQEASNKLGFYGHKSYRTHIPASASSLCSLKSSSSSPS